MKKNIKTASSACAEKKKLKNKELILRQRMKYMDIMKTQDHIHFLIMAINRMMEQEKVSYKVMLRKRAYGWEDIQSVELYKIKEL